MNSIFKPEEDLTYFDEVMPFFSDFLNSLNF